MRKTLLLALGLVCSVLSFYPTCPMYFIFSVYFLAIQTQLALTYIYKT